MICRTPLKEWFVGFYLAAVIPLKRGKISIRKEALLLGPRKFDYEALW